MIIEGYKQGRRTGKRLEVKIEVKIERELAGIKRKRMELGKSDG